jgi:hypothetical protein
MPSASVPPMGRSNHLYSIGQYIPYTSGRMNNCNNTLCYTYNHSYVYFPGSAYGMVGTTASSYLARRKRL